MFSYKNGGLRFSYFDLYMRLILLLPITTLFQGYYVASINKILFIMIFWLQLLLITRGITKSALVFLLISFCAYVIVYMNSVDKAFANDKVYFINWLIYAVVVSLHKEDVLDWFREHEYFVQSIVKIWTLLVAVSIPLASSWFVKEGGGLYFGSFPRSSFRLCPTALFICALILVSIRVYDRRSDIIYMILPIFCGAMGSSRTYFVVIVCTAVMGIYFISGEKMAEFIVKMLPLILIGIVLFSYTALFEKVSYTLDDSNYGDFWFRVTSSRSVLWAEQLNAYFNASILKKIFGCGFGFTISASSHYAHNDFIEILVNHGILGIILYFIAFLMLFRTFRQKLTQSKFSFTLCIIIWLFNAMFNMFYYYICAALCYPIILLTLQDYKLSYEEIESDIEVDINKS